MDDVVSCYVSAFERLVLQGRTLGGGPAGLCPAPHQADRRAPRVLIFSPHPDDEAIQAGLPLRLQEHGWPVVNVALTLGSKRERRERRQLELQQACKVLGFDLLMGESDWPALTAQTRLEQAEAWGRIVLWVRSLLLAQQPRLICFPHELDVHPTHVGVHLLVMDALASMPRDFRCHCALGEYWGGLLHPNQLTEIPTELLARMLHALCCHTGELARNPYQASLPCWLVEAVRRGAELVQGPGSAAPDMVFGVLHRRALWESGRLVEAADKLLLGKEEDLRILFSELKPDSVGSST